MNSQLCCHLLCSFPPSSAPKPALPQWEQPGPTADTRQLYRRLPPPLTPVCSGAGPLQASLAACPVLIIEEPGVTSLLWDNEHSGLWEGTPVLTVQISLLALSLVFHTHFAKTANSQKLKPDSRSEADLSDTSLFLVIRVLGI